MGNGRGQKGQALTLALVLLAVSGLVVIPGLSLTSTGLLGARRHESQALDRYAADAGVEHALWRLQYESGFTTSLNPSVAYAKSFNGRTSSITVAAPPTPTPPPAVCPPQTGGHICITSAVSPNVTTASVPTVFTYTMSIYNNGTSRVHLDEIGDLLPQSFTYLPGSAASSGIITNQGNLVIGEPAISIVSGRQQLTWEFGSPAPWIEAGTIGTVTLQASATPTEGTYDNSAWVEADPNDIGTEGELLSTGPPSQVVAIWPQFDITSTAGPVTVKARAKKPDTGIVIRSWQVE